MKTQVELLKESCDIKDAACVRYQKRIAELEEKNKKLEEKIKNMEKAEKDFMDIMKKYILNKWNIIKLETLYDICFEWK